MCLCIVSFERTLLCSFLCPQWTLSPQHAAHTHMHTFIIDKLTPIGNVCFQANLAGEMANGCREASKATAAATPPAYIQIDHDKAHPFTLWWPALSHPRTLALSFINLLTMIYWQKAKRPTSRSQAATPHAPETNAAQSVRVFAILPLPFGIDRMLVSLPIECYFHLVACQPRLWLHYCIPTQTLHTVQTCHYFVLHMTTTFVDPNGSVKGSATLQRLSASQGLAVRQVDFNSLM